MGDVLFKLMNSAIEKDGFLFIGILGEKGLGKSVLGLNLVYEILKDWEKVLRHTIFTITDFNTLPFRKDLIRHDDGRVKVLLWDDFALHTSSYGFAKRGERDLLIDFIEHFEVVREEVAVLIVTAATWDMIPPKLRTAAHVFINMKKRGVGEVWVKQRSWLFLRKDYKKVGEIESKPIPIEIYKKYREMKKRAKRVKEKMTVIKQIEKAKALAKELTDEEWADEELLMAYGIIDTHGNLTEFGKLVKKFYNEYYGIPSNNNNTSSEGYSSRVFYVCVRQSSRVKVWKELSKTDNRGRVTIPLAFRKKYNINDHQVILWLDFGGKFIIGVPDIHYEEFMNFFFKAKEGDEGKDKKEEKEEVKTGHGG